jgi:hypothetical protein
MKNVLNKAIECHSDSTGQVEICLKLLCPSGFQSFIIEVCLDEEYGQQCNQQKQKKPHLNCLRWFWRQCHSHFLLQVACFIYLALILKEIPLISYSTLNFDSLHYPNRGNITPKVRRANR